MEDMQTDFTKTVIRLIRSVPKGKVATYGLIAKLAGRPKGSRGVGWILHSSTNKHKLPWHRILKSTGFISFPAGTHQFMMQESKLESEGVVVINGKVDLQKYGWKKL
jgi:methylated-DNA-protein-cysteine methyltransferase related protein